MISGALQLVLGSALVLVSPIEVFAETEPVVDDFEQACLKNNSGAEQIRTFLALGWKQLPEEVSRIASQNWTETSAIAGFERDIPSGEKYVSLVVQGSRGVELPKEYNLCYVETEVKDIAGIRQDLRTRLRPALYTDESEDRILDVWFGFLPDTSVEFRATHLDEDFKRVRISRLSKVAN